MPFHVATPISSDHRFPGTRLVFQRELESVTTPNGTPVRMVECRCDCGTVKPFRLPLLRNGKTKSCGCLKRDLSVERFRTHGGTGTPEYHVWLALRARCADLSNENYGGRGIKVCDRWRDSFEAFLEDMGPRPSEEHSIDRYPNNDGHYEPGNCRWATMAEQGRNKRTNRLVTFEGETLCIAEWAERYGISPVMLCGRLNSGWDFEKAVSVPPRQGDDGFYRTPILKRDAAWYREYELREKGEIT